MSPKIPRGEIKTVPEPIWVADKYIGATVCWFQRVEDGPREEGIAVLRDVGTWDIYQIIDMEGRVVEQPCWKYDLLHYHGAFTHMTYKQHEIPLPSER